MKFTLKDYQDEAVRKSLENLRKAKKRWHEDKEIESFSLTAATGAGKTVMAAAVFEALFHGDDDFDFERDPGAVVIWFSDDPSLNEQTRFRLIEASDKLNQHSDLVVVHNKFNQERFEAGKIYFLNTQKLSKNSNLVRGHNFGDGGNVFPETRPDMRTYTIWDTIKNTIEDSELTLYLVLDEAHRGMGNSKGNDRATIVKRLINGVGSVPPIPIVLGISATVDRFTKAMADAKDRVKLNDVIVDSSKVQESGLLKDTILLETPDGVGQFDTVLVRRATDKIRESSLAWSEYAKQQDENRIVKPLMVLQVPNNPSHDDIGRAISTIYNQWPELESASIAHVFGEHKSQTFGAYTVPYISPERVEQTTSVRVLIAKDAISTGWDCPRAEVMVSFRPAVDCTHITQLLGRMVRTPLARRIPGNDRLNSVDCLLPFFDSKSVKMVADALMHGSSDIGDEAFEGRRVLINPIEVRPNVLLPEKIWDALRGLPSEVLPQRGAKPVKRLTLLAHHLASDGLLPNAGEIAHREMHKILDAARARYSDEIITARKTVLIVQGKTLDTDLKFKMQSFNDFVEVADYAVIEDAYRRASRVLSPDLAKTYAEHLASQVDHDLENIDEVLVDAHTDIAALGLVPAVKGYLESEAVELAKKWFGEYRVQIKDLSDERQEIYREIKVWSTDPQSVELVKPTSRMEATTLREEGGDEHLIPLYKSHLLCNDDGLCPAVLNEWESTVLNKEMSRKGFVAWYRNPARASQDSLGVAYIQDGEHKIMRPDFIFFSEKEDGSIVADIVDPHGHFLSDSLPKLKGLADFAEAHGSRFRRIDAVADFNGTLRVLDLMDSDVVNAIRSATEAKGLYSGYLSNDY